MLGLILLALVLAFGNVALTGLEKMLNALGIKIYDARFH